MYLNKVDYVQISFKIFGSNKDKFYLHKKQKKIGKGHREKRGCGLADKVKDEWSEEKR